MSAQPKAETLQRWIGRRFGRLTVVAFDHYARYQMAYWRCRCDCGNETVAANANLLSSSHVSCGCYRNELLASGNKARTTHGLSRTRTYALWLYLLRAHEDELCDRWLDVEDFYADMGEQPTGTLLTRRDANKPFEPENCYWASRLEFARQTRHCVWLEFQGRRQIMREWADELGMSRQLLSLRLKSGWSVERALSTPVGKVNS